MADLYRIAFRVSGAFFDRNVRVSARGEHVVVEIETVLPVGAGGDDCETVRRAFDMRPGDAGVLAMKLLEAMSAANRERAARMVRDTLRRIEAGEGP